MAPKQKIACVSTKTSVTLVCGKETHQIGHKDKNYAKVRALVKKGQREKAWSIVSALSDSLKLSKTLTLKDGRILYKDRPVANPAVTALLDVISEAERLGVPADTKPLTRFLDRILTNPSTHSVDSLWNFMKAARMTLLDDGRFIAYKKVHRTREGRLVDQYTKTFDNSVGEIVRMPREKVVEDPSQTCSQGLHVCSERYLSEYGTDSDNTTIIVAVDPADVVSVPNDHANAKMRVCAYEVLELRGGDPHSTTREFTTPTHTPKAKQVGHDVSLTEAIKILGLAKTKRPMNALLKRLARGVTCKRVGEDRVRILVAPNKK